MKKIVLSLILAVAAMMLFVPSGSVFAAKGDLTTESYNAVIDLRTDKTADVTETVKMRFSDYSNGILRKIPLQQKAVYRDSDGNVISTENIPLKVSNVSVKNAAFDTYKKGGYTVIQIGNKDEYMSGSKTFIISYKIKMYTDKTKKYDSFCLSLLPSDWGSGISSSEISINMPRPVEERNIDVITGKAGSSSNSGKATWSLKGNTIDIITKSSLKKDEVITARVMLKEGYFKGAASMRWMMIAEYAVFAAALILLILLVIRFGRDPKRVPQIEFSAPDGITPAEVGFIADGRADRKDILSLLLYWAELGHIKIQETGGENGQDHVILKLKELPADAKDYERTLFNSVFKGMRNSASLSGIGEELGRTVDVCRKQLKKQLGSGKSRVYSRPVNMPRIAASILCAAAVIVPGIFLWVIYGSLIYPIIFAVFALLLIASYFISFMTADDREAARSSKVKRNALSLILLLISAAAAFWLIARMQSEIPAAVGAAAVAAAGFLATRYMRKRTKFGADIYSRVLGLRQFIIHADEEKIMSMNESDPKLFYELLPYACVMGISKKWAAKFKHITVTAPEWYTREDMREDMSASGAAEIANKIIGLYPNR